MLLENVSWGVARAGEGQTCHEESHPSSKANEFRQRDASCPGHRNNPRLRISTEPSEPPRRPSQAGGGRPDVVPSRVPGSGLCYNPPIRNALLARSPRPSSVCFWIERQWFGARSVRSSPRARNSVFSAMTSPRLSACSSSVHSLQLHWGCAGACGVLGSPTQVPAATMAKRPRSDGALPLDQREETDRKRGGGSRADEEGRASNAKQQRTTSRFNYAVICSSNINRSMEAHVAFFNNKLRVGSYGAGRMVRLPMPGGPGDGRSYEFGTPYETMLNALASDVKNESFYRKTRLLDILKRNKQIKLAPERWQDTDFDVVRGYDVVVCFEQRIFDAVIEDLQSREPREMEHMAVICIETRDDPKEAVVGGRLAAKLALKLEECGNLEAEAPEIIEEFQKAENRKVIFQACYL